MAIEWDEHWDTDARTVASATGQLTWDYGDRVVRVHSEKTQGIVGFAGGGVYDLPAVTVDVTTPFVSLLFTPLDDRPLISSGHILITAMARDRQTGTEYNEDGTQLVEVGGPPLLLEPVQAEIQLKGMPIDSVRVVDVYGVPGEREVERTGNTFAIDGRYAAYYYEVKRQVARVSVEREDPNVVLSWEDLTGRLILEETSSLSQAWEQSGLAVVVEEGLARTIVEGRAGQAFFRLVLED
jgi:hypothetical protein